MRLRVMMVAGLAAVATALGGLVTALPATADTEICEQFGVLPIQGGNYIVQNDRWGANTTQCIMVNDNGFRISRSEHNNSTNGPPAGYPSVIWGCAWGDCTNNFTPVQASSAAFPGITTSVNTTLTTSGTWNQAFDIWFDPTARRDGQVTGTEMMVWPAYRGDIQPFGNRVGSATLAGANWDVWFGRITDDGGSWNVVSYVRLTQTNSITFQPNTFWTDTIARGYGQRAWYLTSIQSGYEVWNGGVGLAVNSFSVTNGGGGGDTTPPSTPTNLTASNVTSSSASLSWAASSDNVGVTGYDIYRATGGGTPVQVGTTGGTSFSATGLSPSTTYTFTVKARDAAGNTSGSSNAATVTTLPGAGDTTPPTAPTNLTASNVTSSSASLSWAASSDNVGVTGYDVFRATGGGTPVQVGTTGGTSFSATGLSPSTSYTFTVRARDAAGNTSGSSNGATITTPPGGGGGETEICEQYGVKPIQGGNYIVQNDRWGADTTQCIMVNDNGFRVSRSEHDNPTDDAPAGYPSVIWGCAWGDCTNNFTPVQASSAAFPGITTSVNTTLLTSGTWNQAFDIWFDPTPRRDGQVTGTEMMVWPAYRGDIQPYGSKVGTANLAGASWDVWFGDIGQWNVVSYVRTAHTNSITFQPNVFWTDTIARGYGQRAWYMTSIQSGFEIWNGGVGLAVNSFSVTNGGGGGDTTPPTAPTNLTASNVTSSSAALSWTASTDNVGVTGYDIYRATGSGTPVQVGTATGTSFNATGLAASTSYTFTVKARDAAGNTSASSNPATITTLPGGGGATCKVTFTKDVWSSGFVYEIDIHNTGTSSINGWTLTFNVSSGQRVFDWWRATGSQSGTTVTARNRSWNALIPAGGSTHFGVEGTSSGTNPNPTGWRLNGTSCSTA